MDEQLQEDWLDARLRDEAPYIDDAGFTARVMQQLPAPRQTRSSRGVRSCSRSPSSPASRPTSLPAAAGFVGESAAFLVAMPIWTVCVLAGFSGLLVMALGTAAAMKAVAPAALVGRYKLRACSTSRAICAASSSTLANFFSGRRITVEAHFHFRAVDVFLANRRDATRAAAAVFLRSPSDARRDWPRRGTSRRPVSLPPRKRRWAEIARCAR